MNVLILSAGTRNKIVQYFKKAIGNGGIVVATDMSILRLRFTRQISFIKFRE